MVKNVVFDVDGVVSYPDFTNKVIRPLEKIGVNIRFWSLNDRAKVLRTLNDFGLNNYGDTLVARYDYTSLESNLRAALKGEKNYFEDWLINHKSDVPFDTALRRGQVMVSAIDRYGLNVKIPTILYDGDTLLVESDCAYWDRIGKKIRTGDSEFHSYSTLIGEANFSLLYVPEHPEIWNEARLAMRPEEVMTHIAERVLHWDGNVFSENIAESTGLYRDQQSHHPER